MILLQFFVEGLPKGQPRPKAYARGKRAAVYDPGTANGWKSCVKLAAREHLPQQPITGPIAVDLTFRMPRPASRTKKRSPNPEYPHTSTPDADNLAKAVLDALSDLQVWVDDAQVYDLHVVKRVVTPGERTGCTVSISAEPEAQP